jgi:phenylacetate-CoA ligase
LYRYDRPQNRWIVSASSTTEDRLDDLQRWARGLPPFFLHVYPSSLYTFVDLLGEKLFRALPVRGILAGSESFPTGEQERFERDFGIRVAHWYGHSEYAVLAYRCVSCRGFHFYPTYGYVELLEATTDQLRRVVTTSFNRIGTQFVRYDTGDLASAPVGICDNHFPRVNDIVGRSQETFMDSAGRRRALGCYIFGIHGAFWDQIRDLQFVQDRPGGLRVLLVTSQGADRERIQRTLEQRLPMVRLEYQYVAHVTRRPNGKRTYFIDACQ